MVDLDDKDALRASLIDSYRSGTLLKTISDLQARTRNDREQVAAELAALHNDGEIDVLAAYSTLQWKGGPDFFVARYPLEIALPALKADVKAVMACTVHLYAQAGRDLAAGAILNSFASFCETLPSRATEALEIIESAPDVYFRLLVATLNAGSATDPISFQAHAVRLASSHVLPDVRRFACHALGTMQNPDPASVVQVLNARAQVETDDSVLAAILSAAVSLVVKGGVGERDWMTPLIELVSTRGGPIVNYTLSEALWLHSKELQTSPEVVQTAFKHLAAVPRDHGGTISNIDHAVAALLKGPAAATTVEFLERYLVTLVGLPFADTFPSLLHEMCSNRPLLDNLATRWLSKGQPALCNAIREVLARFQENNLVINVDPSEIDLSDSTRVYFFARKTLGYLLRVPTTAASILVSLLEKVAMDELRQDLVKLLVNPLLYNYPSTVERYLVPRKASATGPEGPAITQAIALLETYLAEVRSVGSLPELWPSERQVTAYNRHFSREVADSFKEAQKKSVLMSLVSRSVLLYGRTSVSHVYDGQGNQRRVEIPLASHGVTFEIPRLEHLDPVGLDFQQRFMRVEQLKST